MPRPTQQMTQAQANVLGVAIRGARGRRSQPQIATAAGVSQKWLSQIENGRNLAPATSLLDGLSLALGLPEKALRDLIEGEPLPEAADSARGAFPPAALGGHGGTEGWSEYLEEKYNESVRLSREAKETAVRVLEEVAAIRSQLDRFVRESS